MSVQKEYIQSYKKVIGVYRAKNYPLAFQQFRALQTKDTKSNEIKFMMGLCHVRLNEPGRARPIFETIISSEKERTFPLLQSHMILAYLFTKEGDFDTGEGYLHELLKKNVENSQIYSILGYIYNKRKDYPQAEYYYKKALSIDPNNANVHNSLGYNYLLSGGNTDDALTHIEFALDRDRDNPAYLDTLGWLWFIKNKVSKAIFFLTRAFRAKKHPIIEKHLEEARLRQKNGDTNET